MTSSHAQWQITSRIFGIVTILMLVMTFVATSPASASGAEESSFISRVNATRAANGLPALKTDSQLTNLARGWATSMQSGTCGSGNYICHASPISAGVTHPWEKLGENVGTGPNVASVMDAFIASPGHYANIIDPEFTHIGVGVVWEGNRMFTTHRFMKLQTTTPTTTAAPAPTTTTAPQTTTAPTTAAPRVTTTTAAPQARTAATPKTTTTAAPTTKAAPISTNNASSPAQTPAQNTPVEDSSASDTAPQDAGQPIDQQPAVLEERVTVLIDAFTSVG